MKQADVQKCRSGRLILYAVGLALILSFGGCATKPAVLGERIGGRVYHNVAFSPDGRFLATSDVGESIVFDIGSRRECSRFKPDKKSKAGMLVGLSYTPEGRLLAAHLGDKSVTVWDTGASNVVARVELSDQPGACALSPDGRWLATAPKNQAATIWEVGTARKVAELTNGPTVGMVFSREGRWLAAVGADQGICICETVSGQLVSKLLSPGGPVRSLAFAPEAGMIAVSANDVNVLSLTNSELRQAIRSPSLSAGAKAAGMLWILTSTFGGYPSGSGEVFSTAPSGQVEFSPTGTHLAMINSAANLDTALAHGRDQVCIFELTRTQLVSTVAYNTDVSSIGFSPDGNLIATAGDAVDVWDWKNQGGTSGRPSAFASVVVRLETNCAAKPNSPLGRAVKPVHVVTFPDGGLQRALGERTAAFHVKMSDVLPSRPVAESMREAVANLFAHHAQPAQETPAALNIVGTVTKFSVRTPASVWRWKIEAEVEVELRVSDAAGTLVHSAVYRGQASRSTAVWPTESLIEKTCNEALQQLLQRIQDDAVWERL